MFEVSVCRKSSTAPWRVFIDHPDIGVCIYDATKTVMVDALALWRDDVTDAQFIEIWDTFICAMKKNRDMARCAA